MKLLVLLALVLIQTSMAQARLDRSPVSSRTPFPSELPHLCDVEDCSPLAKEWVDDYRKLKGFTPSAKDDAFDGKCEMQGRNVFGNQAYSIFQMSPVGDQIYFDGRFSGPVTDVYTGQPNLPSWNSLTKQEIKSEMSENDGREPWKIHLENDFAYVDSRTPKHDEDFVIWMRTNEAGTEAIVMGYFSLREEFVCRLHVVN